MIVPFLAAQSEPLARFAAGRLEHVRKELLAEKLVR